MTVDVSPYRKVMRPALETAFRSRPTEPVQDIFESLGLATHCSFIVMAHLTAEIVGMTPELRVYIDRMKAFYKITKVIGAEHE